MRILAEHPEISQVQLAARSQAGQATTDADPGLPHHYVKSGLVSKTVLSPDEALADPGDVLFSALPHGASAEQCAPVFGTIPVIDLSADFRFRDPARFETAYGNPPPAAEHQDAAVYGLSEWNRAELASASIVANPGCYPTASLTALLPVVAAGLITGPVVINALSGISGAGKSPKANLLLSERTENANSYLVGSQHRHQGEIAEQLALRSGSRSHSLAGAQTGAQASEPVVLFNPHLVPMKQGMAATIVVPTDAPKAAVAAITERYADEPFIELTGETPPETRHVRGSNRVRIGWRLEQGHVVLMSVIDNLWKGASGQAVQNMNIRFGWDETTGLIKGIEL